MHKETSNILYGILSWVVGAFVFYLVLKGFAWLGDTIGIPMRFDHGEENVVTYGTGPMSYEADASKGLTNFGWLGAIISLMIASRVGMAINCKEINGKVKPEGNIDYFAWLAGVSIYLALTLLTGMAFERYSDNSVAQRIEFFLYLVEGGGIWWVMSQLRRSALERLKNKRAESSKREHELIKKERAEESKREELALMPVVKMAVAVKKTAVKEAAAKKPEIAAPIAPAFVRPAASWPFPTSGLGKPEAEAETKDTSSQ
jgi:hypothetical protein